VRSSLRNAGRVLFVLAALATATAADAQPGRQEPTLLMQVPVARAAQGVAVVASGGARDEAFTLARAVYASSLRPRSLDELRARILAGDPAPPSATRDVRELAELRAGVTGEDAASRKLLASIAQQLGVQALLVVSRGPLPPSSEQNAERKQEEAAPAEVDAGAAASSVPSVAADAGASDAGAARAAAVPPAPADAGAAPAAPGAAGSPVSARLFLADTGEFDAARYEPDASGWRGTVTSLSSRFPPPPAPRAAQLQGPPPKLSSEEKRGRPFYMSPWLWGAVGAAALIGGFFFFATRDTGDDPIHLQMRVPR